MLLLVAAVPVEPPLDPEQNIPDFSESFARLQAPAILSDGYGRRWRHSSRFRHSLPLRQNCCPKLLGSLHADQLDQAAVTGRTRGLNGEGAQAPVPHEWAMGKPRIGDPVQRNRLSLPDQNAPRHVKVLLGQDAAKAPEIASGDGAAQQPVDKVGRRSSGDAPFR